MPNRNYQKGYRFEKYLVDLWNYKGYLSYRMHGSKPFDFWVMGHGIHCICEAKNWRKPPTERRLRRDYRWLKDMADKGGCTALVYSKQGRGEDNYIMYKL